MKIRSSIFFILLSLAVNSIILAFPQVKNIAEVYSGNEKRSYSFILNDSTIGTLDVTYKGPSSLEGIKGFLFNEVLNLDFNPLGQDYKLKIENHHYVTENNLYIGDDMSMYINDQFQKFFFKKEASRLIGYSVKGSEDEDLSLPQRDLFSSMDNYLIDQIELYLSFKDLNIGDTIYDTVFIPQTLLMSDIEFSVDDFVWTRYGDVYDSAYLCHFSRPTEMTVFYSKERKVVKMLQQGQSMEVVLNETPYEKMAPKTIKSFSFGDIVKRLPLYLVYLIFGLICAAPVLINNYKTKLAYTALLLGAIIYTLSYSLLFPLQKWYSIQYILPAMQVGGSLYLMGLLPSMLSGFILELLKVIPIAVLFYWQKPKQKLSIIIGLMVGVGFGIFEACSLTGAAYQSGSMGIFSLAVGERLAVILFHTGSGAALGYGINRGWKYLAMIWLAVFLIHSFSDYMILFVQSRAINVTLLVIIKAIIALIIVLISYVMIKMARKR
ncbi:MAG: hypothetical protein ABIJ45_14130 [Candidatus Zixiibacteriota bacterium]